MLRLNEIKLPLGHSDKELELAILNNLQIKSNQLLGYNLIKRSIDARRNKNIQFTFHKLIRYVVVRSSSFSTLYPRA